MGDAEETIFGKAMSGNNDDTFDVDKFIEENIGEGKKFASPEEALKALVKKTYHGDTFIETLKMEKEAETREKEQLKAQLADSKKIDDLLKILAEEGVVAPAAAPAAPAPPDGGQPSSAQLSRDDVASVVSEILSANQTAAEKKANVDKAWANLIEGFGSEANAKLAVQRYTQGDEARGKLLDQLGQAQPEAVAEFLRSQLQNDDTFTGAEGTDFIPGMPHGNAPMRIMYNDLDISTWDKVKQIRKDHPKLYRDPEFQVEVHRAAAANPDFYGKKP